MLGRLQDADIKLLRLFRTIVQCGGFTPAQAQLNISQSAISTQMAQLEARLGCRLCERGRGAFALTAEGKAVIQASDKLFAALEDFRTDVAEAQGRLGGELRLGLIDTTVTHADARIRNSIRRFSETAPDADISIYVGNALELEQQLLDDRLHVAIGIFNNRPDTLVFSELIEEQQMLYCSSEHELFRSATAIDQETIAALPYVSWGHAEREPSTEGPVVFNRKAQAQHIEGVAYLILTGHYVGFLPTHYAHYWVQQGSMRALLPAELQRRSILSTAYKKAGRKSKLTECLLHLLTHSADAK
ncbi:MAG: LysR family transcriptional regulator [Halioglobus sp.]|nr:LysR family transcriptional regulator [Halioglobus sp.]|tara:strand:+ start:3344 stop:4249 length:906 start_codon:yes stop_codon:yes gene_type:complete